ncbi:unnamed protein product [Cuscuta campestris]|uniref:Reverse transcriptase domain-containing protein n=1 Tax=Cuscuta campestris TaxID=132261 RepID=A0A484KGK8_9ASTE|nr:unnamed protein product [Cuscuta campestris]
MYEVDTFTALKASMESLIKRTIQDQFSASSHPNKQRESIAQADAYYQGGSSSHQNELVMSCESCTGAHLTSQCPYNESTTKERPREVHLAQYANKGEGPWAPNQYQPAYQHDDPSRERNNNNFLRNNRSRDDYKQGGWNNNTNWNSQRGSGYNQGGNTQVYVPPHQRQAEDPMAEMKRMMEEQNKRSEERIQRLEESMRQLMDKMTIRPPGTLPAKTETNPREHLNAVTLRSGKEVQGVGQSTEPTLEEESEVEVISQPTEENKKEPEKKEERKDKEPSQSQHANSNLLPKKVTVPFPSRVKKKNDDQAFKKFLDIMGQVEVKLPLIDVLTEMPKYAKFIKDLVMHKKDWEGVSMINLNASCSALLLQQLPEKCKDPDPTEFCHSVKILKDKGSVETLLGLEAVLKEEENEGIKCEDVREVETKGSDTLELKPLPKHLEYAFLDDEGKCPVVIASELTVDQKAELLTVLRRHKQAIAWKLEDIQGISPAFCTHRIAIEEGFKPVVQTQR